MYFIYFDRSLYPYAEPGIEGADKYFIENGDDFIVETGSGFVNMKARVDEQVMEGAFMQYQKGLIVGSSIKQILDTGFLILVKAEVKRQSG